MDARGDSVAVWSAPEGAEAERIEASVRPAGGDWGAPVPLSPAGVKTRSSAVAIDDAGNATVVWLQEEGETAILRSSTLAVGSTWTPAVDVSRPGEEPSYFEVAVDSAGEAVVSYDDHFEVMSYRVRVTTRQQGGAWAEPITISAAGEQAEVPVLSVGSGGDIAVLWVLNDGVRAVEHPAGGGWTEPVFIVKGENNFFVPAVAVAPDGEAVAVWRNAINGVGAVVESATETGGVWSEPVELGVGFFYSQAPRVAVDGGEAVALWERRREPEPVEVVAATKPKGGAWSAPTELSHSGEDGALPSLAISPAGQAVAAWTTGEMDERAIHASVRAPGAGWGAPTDLTAPGDSTNPTVAADARGDAVMTWEAEASAGAPVRSIEAAGYDGAGPEIRTVSIPASGTAGVPVPFAVDAVNVWSGISSVAWTFGDGTGATGATPSHVYNAPGRFPVGLTAVDALGNSTIATGAVTVGLPPKGVAHGSRTAIVRKGKAALGLTCASAQCAGLAELLVKPAAKHAKGAKKKKPRLALAGKSAFSIAPAAHATVGVKLKAAVLKRLGSAPRHQLKVRLQGEGVQAGSVTLRLAPHHGPHRK